MGNDVQLCLRPAHFQHGFLRPDKSLAAAISCNADAIITMIREHFSQQTRDPYDIETQHPDDFVMIQIELSKPGALCAINALRLRCLHSTSENFSVHAREVS